ncbi:hypothetical protein [Brevundimonas sp. TWP2-3-4b2]|uniref:hypothetical protein n=1 Tax=Brevundimonas sp. TWP2-3-4b2 TaxID=2804595 RepID=UPI003CF6FC04
MDRRFWEKILPASVLAVGIATAGYFVGGGYTVVEADRGSVFVVDRLSGAVRKCVVRSGSAECAIVQRAGIYSTFDEAQANQQPYDPDAAANAAAAAADAAMAPVE